MDKTIGFIGCGKMAQAMIAGMIKKGVIPAGSIIASAYTEITRNMVRDAYGIRVTSRNQEAASESDLIFLAVKPDLYKGILDEIKPVLKEDAVIVTIAAGISLEFMEKELGDRAKIVRTMPNTPSLVGEGCSAICPNGRVTVDDLDDVLELFNSFGRTEVLKESLMDAVPAISGSSPAYVYMFIEALADGGVRDGIPREQAYRMAAQAVLGAAQMVLETGIHPGVLKDNVCTPGGATIQAVAALEKHNFRSAVLAAMESCTNKSKGLQKDKG
ncbi:pyrroline-5-carboxylate reductase [Peribacillus sp. SCS-26]|uniref:pyrroline-5-carboxylate reductase n=1 Tax=Paraperibacillus marinus TaxID=3115295 RepID=UPI0039065F5C